MNGLYGRCRGAAPMPEKRRLSLSFSLAQREQRDAWERLSAVAPGQRMDAVCRMINGYMEQQELLDKRQKDRAEVEAEKEQWLQQQLAADVAASQARLQAFSKELAGQVVQEQTGLSLTGKKTRNQEGQPELDKLI